MSEIEFPVGSVVMLKSGGPEMTITSYKNGIPVCQYFYDGQYQVFTTFQTNLKHVETGKDNINK